MVDATLKQQILSILNCAINANQDVHLCKDPLQLSCGHHICRECRDSDMPNSIKCSFCNEMNKRDLDQTQKPQLFNIVLDKNLDLLLYDAYKKLKTIFGTYKDTVHNGYDAIESHIQYMKDEIFIKIESLKIELDKIYESFLNELDEIETNWKLDYKTLRVDYFNEKLVEKELKILKENIRRHEDLTRDDLYYCENQVKVINDALQRFRKSCPELIFEESDSVLDKNFIGEIIYEPNGDVDERLLKRISENEYKELKIGEHFYDISIFSNGDMLFPNHNNSNLLVYNKNMQLIKTVNLINNEPFRVICSTIDSNDHVYLSDFNNDYIIKTDKEFNQLGRFGNGYGNAHDQLRKPSGICYFNDGIYVCDKENNRIQKLDSNLNYVATFNLEYSPWYIKVIDNVAMIRPHYPDAVFFYNLKNFNLIKKYDGHSGLIGCSNLCFYEYYPANKTFYCYDRNGELIKCIQTNGMNSTSINNWGSIFIFKSKLYLNIAGNRLLSI